MSRMWKWTALGLCLLLLLTACGKPDAQGEELDPKEREEALAKLDKNIVKAQNAFGLRLHRELSQNADPAGNLVLSPYSIATALALAYNGSGGETAAEMEKALGWNGMGLDKVNEANRLLKEVLERGSGVKLNVANAVWVQKGLKLQDSYQSGLKEHYGAEARSADLSSDASVKEINGWVSDKTNGMIKKILNEPSGASSILANAIYFNGKWMDEFNPDLTQEKDFFLSDGSVQKVPMMTMEKGFGYKESGAWQAVRLPYRDGRMHMLIILPRETSSLDELHKQIWKDLSVWSDDFSFATVKLGLPKFKAESEDLQVVKALQALGIRKAFEESEADFSRILEGQNLYIDQVRHKAVVEVDEKGTEAAAATVVGMPTSAQPPSETVEMTVNRPFFLAIEDRDTGAWLFVGSVNRP